MNELKAECWGEETAKWSRALAVFTEDPGSVPQHLYTQWFTAMESGALFRPPRALHATYMQADHSDT